MNDFAAFARAVRIDDDDLVGWNGRRRAGTHFELVVEEQGHRRTLTEENLAEIATQAEPP